MIKWFVNTFCQEPAYESKGFHKYLVCKACNAPNFHYGCCHECGHQEATYKVGEHFKKYVGDYIHEKYVYKDGTEFTAKPWFCGGW